MSNSRIEIAAALEALATRRLRVALAFTALTMVTYFGFIGLVAYAKPLMGRSIASGLSIGIALGAFVIVLAWVLTAAYVRWANRVYDGAIAAIRSRRGRS
jgi:uncharacterized membrane protein (DUF485 family)